MGFLAALNPMDFWELSTLGTLGALHPGDFWSASAFWVFGSTISFGDFLLKFYISWQPWIASPCIPGGQHCCRRASWHGSEECISFWVFWVANLVFLESFKVCFLFSNSTTPGSSRMSADDRISSPTCRSVSLHTSEECISIWGFGSFPLFGDFCTSPLGSILEAHIPAPF